MLKNLNRATDYLTPKARLTFIKLRKAFTKAPILQHFDLECYIRIETDVSGYSINKALSQLISDDLNQCYPIAYYSQKMVLAKTQYKTHKRDFSAIIKALKI